MPIKEIHANVVIRVEYPDGSTVDPRLTLDLIELLTVGEKFGSGYKGCIKEIDFTEIHPDPVL